MKLKSNIYLFFIIIKHKIFILIKCFKYAFILIGRGFKHDLSKFSKKEFSIYARYILDFKDVKYNSKEYKKYIEFQKDGILEHYRKNRHHPEYFSDYLNDMNIIDFIEMFIDWQVASKKNVNGNIVNSIEIKRLEYNYSFDIKNILLNSLNL